MRYYSLIKIAVYRFIDQLNVSITTNRSCTLKCNHCYIEPELFKSKDRISVENYKKVFDQIERLKLKDGRLKNIEWEVIGGETTMMPFEFWEEMLPYTLDRIARINHMCEKKGALNFLTNLIYKDKRYTDLFNQYGDHPLFCLYTSWEPDTNRFGNNDKLLPKFKKTLGEINAKEKILDIILTKAVVEMDPTSIIEEFGALGITDYSIKQLSPYGSGKEFFKHNMVSFKKMADFLIRFDKAREKLGGTFTPFEEMLGAFSHGTAFQCNGNFKYDLSIEPDGHTHFNANQTMGDMVVGFKPIYIHDENWAERVMFENTTEEANKLTLKHEECTQCEYLRFCNAGWYHYKLLPKVEYEKFAQDECSGFKSVWKRAEKVGYYFDQCQDSHLNNLSQMTAMSHQCNDIISYLETESDGYEKYIENSSSAGKIEMVGGIIFGKSVLERCFYYESLGVSYRLPSMNLINPDLRLVNHVYSSVLSKAEFFPHEFWSVVKTNSSDTDMAVLIGCYDVLAKLFNLPILGTGTDVVVDRRNDEIFRSLLIKHFMLELCEIQQKLYIIEDEYLRNLISRISLEAYVEKSIKSQSHALWECRT